MMLEEQQLFLAANPNITEDANSSTRLISALKGSRLKQFGDVQIASKKTRSVTFSIEGVILPNHLPVESDDDDDLSRDNGSMGTDSDTSIQNSDRFAWYFQLCINFNTEVACQTLNLKHKEIFVGGMMMKRFSTDIFSKLSFVFFDFPTATVRWTKKESDKQLVRDHKYVKVGSMNASVPLGKGKGTAVDIELTEGTSGSIVLFINNGNKLELKVMGSLLLDWYRLLRRFLTHR